MRLPPPKGVDAGGCVVMAIAFFPHPANDNVLYVCEGAERRRRRVDRTRETNCSPVYSIETSGRGRMIVQADKGGSRACILHALQLTDKLILVLMGQFRFDVP